MKSVQKIDLGLTGYDELFMNDAERKENKLPRIYDIPLSEIDDFPDHPFKVKLDEDMDQLVQSIKERGIITPVTLRPKEDGRYEIVSGHRRKKACELAGFDTVKAEVRELTRDEAIILMVESNLQRSVILPSEKAFSYKMRLEAMKRQAGRPAQDNYSPLGNNSFGTKSSDEMAAEVGESKNTIFRYIRLTELIPELLDLVDEGRIAFRPAVELSYLQKEEQRALLEQIAYADPVGAEAANYTVELNVAPAVAVAEQVQKGNIAIIKHSDNGDTQIETPEEGAVFAVYLKAAGSYEAAKDTERDYLTCDENGFAQSKDLPYGVYTVHQVSGWEGRELMSDFDVFIAKNGETYRYLINNANFESFIKVIKVDAETGNTIPYAGAGFQIFRPDGSKVEMTFTYPEVTTIDTFYTNDAGMLITPEKLEFGKGYSLKEVSAPYGYVLSHEAVKFDVAEENSTEESGVTVVAVKLGNYAQKGIIKISKTGEVFASVAAADGVYQPVYAVQGLAGATYEIKAATDIYTPDGTLRCSAGEVVDTVTTGADGMVESKPLYLGKYEITEMKAPDGMAVNKDVHTAELVYAGQEIEITETAASFCNDRQKARISLSKVLEQNKQFGIGMNNELSAVTFGFYAAEELTAADDSAIPADGLIEIMSLDENGKAVLKSDVPFGSYYVKEISTDSHYILSDEKYPVIFAYAGQEIPVVELAVNDGKSITNEMIYGEIHGMKKDEDGKALAGATIGLFLTDGTEPILTTVSAEGGSFTFVDIPYGEYVVREIAAPEGYVMDDTA